MYSIKHSRIVRIAVLICLLGLVPLAAHAALGGDVSSVQADQARLKASLRVKPASGYSIHEMAAPTGVSVREYVSPAGKVFAVSWQGPVLPDMRQVMGTYFDQYSQAAQARRRHGPLVIREPGLVVVMAGHMRSFAGRAYVPELTPADINPEAIP